MKTNKKGISLIVLVITIIVMIILATAIILSLSGSDIRGKAEEAASATDITAAKEIVGVARSEWEIKYDTLKKEYNSFKKYADEKLEEAGIYNLVASNEGAVNIKYTDKNGYIAIIPNGFVASQAKEENNIEHGLVIYEGDEPVTDDNVDIARETRNQFVWVPVPDISKFERVDGYQNGFQQTTISGGGAFEPYNKLSFSNDTTGEWEEWTAMRASVEENCGFYIGRYETGTSIQRTSSSSSVTDIFVQKNKDVYNYVEWGTSMTEVGTTGAVYLSRCLYNTNAIKSTLCYGVQWDAALNFISTLGIKDKACLSDSSGKGNYTGVIEKTGYYKLNNIYDLAGNVGEWTMESSGSNRAVRGYSGGDGKFTPISYRGATTASLGYKTYGFRIALYLK